MEKSDIIASALKTFTAEKAGLAQLEQLFLAQDVLGGLPSSFFSAVQTIAEVQGRVIVTGLGKSGHIGVKLASTLASTGTPAFFVHAAEANHGDLGMISAQDVILALSWSGETVELSGIINHAARFKIPLIAITAGADSALSRHANILLLLPKIEEACPNGLAPTTSTIMQLALGDALSVALLQARGFSRQDFQLYHPGGSLGVQLSSVADIMHKGESLPLVPLGMLMPDAMRVLTLKHFGCVIVINAGGGLEGIITDGDLARNIDRDISNLTVEQIMTQCPKTITADTLLAKAALIFQQTEISALLVVEATEPVGLVHFHDLLRLKVV